jgi:hypothetical protein
MLSHVGKGKACLSPGVQYFPVRTGERMRFAFVRRMVAVNEGHGTDVWDTWDQK